MLKVGPKNVPWVSRHIDAKAMAMITWLEDELSPLLSEEEKKVVGEKRGGEKYANNIGVFLGLRNRHASHTPFTSFATLIEVEGWFQSDFVMNAWAHWAVWDNTTTRRNEMKDRFLKVRMNGI
jgi:hypothetical protein